ncbi:MAG: hemerythrin family protein [Deltaproteobacteria bacterium]|nr:hemerythrin family protein [Deltaproteobacteria bacterium]
MSLFVWSDVFSVGVSQIDTQHKALIDRMNLLYDYHVQQAPKAKVIAALDDLVGYTVKHFTWEEAAMRKAGYAGLEGHIEHHQKLLTQVGEIHEKIKSGQRELDEGLMNFLKNWLQGHILGIDKKYTATLQAHQQAHP